MKYYKLFFDSLFLINHNHFANALKLNVLYNP